MNEAELALHNAEALKQCEDESFIEPEGRAPKRCEECGEIPYNDTLYLYDDEWLCEDCVLSKLPEIDVWNS